MYNQGNYQQFGQRLSAVPPPPPSQFQQAGPTPYGPPVSVRPSGTLTSSQSYLIPPPPPPQNSIWGQSQQISPPVPTPGHHLFYRVPQPPLHPPPSSTYFTPAPLGPFTPPPPPPSSPPGPPPLPPSSPHPKGSSHVNGSEISVKDTSDFNIMSGIPPPPPRDEKTVRKIEVLCQYIAKNGHEFEEMTCQNEVGNPEFEFLFGGPPGSEAAVSHEYFKWMKKKWVTSKLLQGEHNRDLSLKSSDISHSPAGSDMDMEDDITQPEETDIGKSFGSEQQEPDFISNEVDINAEKHACDLEHISFKHVTDDEQFEKSRSKVGVADSELSLDSNTEQNNINLHKEMNQSEESPFRCIQGYASDNSSENDNDQHFENVSPEAVSPKVKEVKEFKNSSELDKGSGSISMPVVEGSLNLTSKIPKPSTKTEYVENRTDGTTGAKDGGAQKEDNNVKLEIDEFGRMVKKGGSDSDSDDYTARWRGKRGRSRSRSRSPYERRRRSPRRRREKRSRSRSWSPKKRGRSRSPYNRRNRSHLREICHDFRLGRCFRGSTCRYYHEPEKSEESRWHKNRRHYHEVSDRLKYSDKLVPEETEVDYQDVSRSSDRVKEEFVEPPGHSAEVASGHENEHPATETAMPGHIPISGPQLAREYNDMPPASLWNSLPLPPPPPPRPQLGGPLPQYHLSQPPFQTTYPFQPFVTPHGPEITTHLGVYPMNYPILQQPTGPTLINQDNFARISSPNLISSNLGQSFLQNTVAESISDFKQSRISTHYNPYASSFDQPLSTKLSSGVFNQYTPDEGQMGQFAPGDQYDPLFDSIDPSSNKKTDAITANEENEEFGETADAEVGAVENDSPTPSSPVDLRDIAPGDIEIDQVKNSGKTKNSKDSRSMKLFKIALADFVKEVLKPSWRQGNMSKEAFKTIVKKTVDKVSGAMKKHQIPKSQAKINHYIDSSQRKLTKLVMGYVDKYVKV